ncbi:peptide/nickel transport system ATP-binding protein [Desulfocicer vacuolatum DSM 3385]|uniref:Peptide/nickel transport system ATP-binding protein n=1 Tax=Desulfocicer vacuolatum DSM 3385 TaxID=1121400 RepID=A0A1W2D0B5_9BACT|nr:ATP-binding cassette domain-containing protein [Desulfocicer vacuolatum]SMC90428.1 peptide/nickel transport system ATP-binding protein [Desulfocicer vacuolatum DSM 3385]
MKKQQNAIIELADISKIYYQKSQLFHTGAGDVVALKDINLTINKGEIFGLVGQSGSGKTTAGRLLVKLENPTRGEIYLKGAPVSGLKGRELKEYRKQVQMIFQDPYQSLNPHLSIAETVMEPLIVHGAGTRESRRQKVLDTLETTGLVPATDFYDRYPHRLSGGQRQRVAIARAIVLEPEFIVADEPSSMLDATIAIQLFQVLLNIRERLGMTFLFITHNLAAAKYLCDRIAVIQNGVIVETGHTRDVIDHPSHPYTKTLIASQPSFDICPIL